LSAAAREHFGGLFEQRHVGLTLQIDEGAEVYDAKHSTIHPLFAKS
jgi:5-carboxymethyl-2-hydroxymuconate isomerase